MADINTVVLGGRLVRNAEIRYTGSGLAICTFSIAVNRRKKSGDEWTDEVSFFDVTMFGRYGEVLQKSLLKGKTVTLQGTLRQDRWEREGETRSKVHVVADQVQLLGGNRGGDADFDSAPEYTSASSNATTETDASFNDDIPF